MKNILKHLHKAFPPRISIFHLKDELERQSLQHGEDILQKSMKLASTLPLSYCQILSNYSHSEISQMYKRLQP